jgi:primosomal protein N' (replication factor Y)
MSSVKTSTALEAKAYALVALDDAVDKLLEYAIPLSLSEAACIGVRVEIPVKNKLRQGTIVDIYSEKTFSSIKPITQVLSQRLISPELFTLARWISRYYCCSLSAALPLIVPTPVRKESQGRLQVYVSFAKPKDVVVKHLQTLRSSLYSQAKILDTLLQHEKPSIALQDLLSLTKVTKSPVDTLVKQGFLHIQKKTVSLEDVEYFPSAAKTLSSEQQTVFEAICSTLESQTYATHLIHGVTGSGKTEIYLQAIAKARAHNKSALMLVPEIALTTQMIERCRSRFQEPVGIYHSRLSSAERFDLWKKVQQGAVSIVLGARSAIFLPFTNLGLCIVDEEHEPSYKQQEKSPCYHGRDAAIYRAALCKACVILGSATPSLESYHNALKGKYQLHNLTKRAAEAALPSICLIDMKKEKEKDKKTYIFSSTLLRKIKEKVSLGEQVLLFLNRRGYHTMLLCSSCEHVEKCKHCDNALTYHHKKRLLSCHTCDYQSSTIPTQCPCCSQDAPLTFKGYGTELVESQLKKIFPEMRTLRMDADTTRTKDSHEDLFKSFRSGKADVLIGTQMIAKGFHFPCVTLVGILNADQSLHSPDFRASEHLFQLLAQVSGRAGRGELPGEVLIQTHMPEHSLFSFLLKEDYVGFFKEEILSRKEFNYPPFCHLAKITFFGKDPEKTRDALLEFHSVLKNHLPTYASLLPPIVEPLAKIQDLFRYSFMIKTASMPSISKLLTALAPSIPRSKTTKTLFEIDS